MKFRKKPVVIDAIQWTGEVVQGLDICDFAEASSDQTTVGFKGGDLVVYTLEGQMVCPPGHWLIRGVKGELYPCAPDIFTATYEAAE
jgi:hypothetical protein